MSLSFSVVAGSPGESRLGNTIILMIRMYYVRSYTGLRLPIVTRPARPPINNQVAAGKGTVVYDVYAVACDIEL